MSIFDTFKYDASTQNPQNSQNYALNNEKSNFESCESFEGKKINPTPTYTALGDYKSKQASQNRILQSSFISAAEIKSLVSIEQVLSRVYGFEVKKRMPCPIHEGTHNNFSVSEKFYHCFSCGASGDIFKLVQDLSKVNFVDAKKILCEYFNLSLGNFKRYQVDRSEILLRLEQDKKEKEERKALERLRCYQEDRICQTLREIRTLDGDSYLEKHLENLLRRFEEKKDFYITHDIHAHLNAVYNRSKKPL